VAWIRGVGLTEFGRRPGFTTLDWQSRAAGEALGDAEVHRGGVDALIAGYATTVGHVMPANLLAERLGIRPHVAFGTSVGGATGLAMLAQATTLVDSGRARIVLVVAGENRASGQDANTSIRTLAQVGHADYEVPLGANVPAYYALVASHYLHRYGLRADDLAPLAVQMREHARLHDGAQFRAPITTSDVTQSRLIAAPLRLLDCCPVSDGGAAFIVSADPGSARAVRISGLGQAHLHQHITEADFDDFGVRRAAELALHEAGIGIDRIDFFGIYDSFTITLAVILEELALAPPGGAGARAADSTFDRSGERPVNTHGGLLSYGHPGVAGGMAHLVEAVKQLRGEGGARQADRPVRRALLHADGGVLSAHVTAILEAQ
jgi:acetyl-CoA acetyltransferase